MIHFFIHIRNMLFSIIFILWLPLSVYGLDTIEVHFIDVGQGDSILIRNGGNNNILIDTGSLANGYKVKRYLKRHGIKSLDDVIITHMHFDHVGGLFGLIPDISIHKIYDNGIELKGDDFWEEYVLFVRDLKLNRGILRQGDHLSFDDLTFKVLAPSLPLFKDLNSDSIAIQMQYGKIKFLIAADLSIKGEKRLLSQGIDLKSQILKVGHHGACDATSGEFLEKVNPEIAVISVGVNNRFGFPCKDTIERIKREDIRLLRTDNNGSVVIRTDGKKYRVIPSRPD